MPEVEIADRWTGSEAGEPPFSRGQALPGYSPDFKANEAVWGWVREEGPGICVWEARPCYSRGSNFLPGLPSRSGEVDRRLPDGPAIKSRRAPAILPDQFRLQRKCTFHLGFSLVTVQVTSNLVSGVNALVRGNLFRTMSHCERTTRMEGAARGWVQGRGYLPDQLDLFPLLPRMCR